MAKHQRLPKVGFVAVAMMLLSAASLGATLDPAALLEAARQNDVEAVRSYAEQGVDVNVPEADGFTPLHWASSHGNAEMARVLLSAGAEVGAVTRMLEHTPLHVASSKGHAEVIAVLVEAGSDLQARSTTGVTPLHLAAESGNGAAVAVLVDAGADMNAQEDAAGQTPLIFAAAANSIDPIRVLLEKGADPDLATLRVDIDARQREDAEEKRLRNERMKAPEIAEFEQTEEEAKAEAEEAEAEEAEAEEAEAEEAEAEEEQQEEEEAVDPRLSWRTPEPVSYVGGMTALHVAARQGYTEIVDVLLASGVDVNQRSADGSTPLLVATINGHWDLGLRMLEAGADPRIASHAGATPLWDTINLRWIHKTQYPPPNAHLNQEIGYLGYMAALVEAGADPNARIHHGVWYSRMGNIVGATPFWRAAYALDVDAMRLLVALGADPSIPTVHTGGGGGRRGGGDSDEEDPSGLPPAQPGDPSITPLIAAAGADYGTAYGYEHHFVPGGFLRAVKFLVEEVDGGDVNTRDPQGYTALHYAASRGDVDVINYLVEHGADVTVVARNGLHPADMANSPANRLPQYPEARDLLISLGSGFNNYCVNCGRE